MSPLVNRIRASQYLSNLDRQLPELSSVTTEQIFSKLDDICVQLGSTDFSSISLDDAEQRLVESKSAFAYLWSLAELEKVGSQEERGRWQTRFSETTIDYALDVSWRVVGQKQKTIPAILKANQGKVPGLFIFGMGKLGGHDLNFSSDVDLVAYFDPLVLPIPDMLGKSYICHQVLQQLTKLLTQSGSPNFIWRVDWRLRPNASATTLAMSTVAAEDYYFYRASPWHRLALMKARVVAGDMVLGNEFLETLTPFIWRQNLDYRALDELAEIKQRINLEHPSLKTQRQWKEPIVDEIEGFNVKLGSGGIREIEFIANALQLVWGGRSFALRTPHTVTALKELAKHQHLDEIGAQHLAQHYRFLRSIENAIQILGNQQTHLIPSSEQNKLNLLILLNLDSWQELVSLINQARHFVHERFDALFSEQEAAQVSAIVWPENLSTQASEIIDAWEDGYQIYGVSIHVRHRLLPLTRELAEYLSRDIENASNTIIRLHDFFRALPQGEQYFRLLAESPRLLKKVVPPLLYSPPMASLLKQSPHIIDCYVHAQWHYPEPFDSSDVLQTERYELQLERMRRFVNEYLYQLYLAFFEGDISVEIFQQALTELAEHTLELALTVVANEMALDEIPISVIGMGKVALGRMSPLSDLDLIFVFDPEHISLEAASRYVSRLQTAISTPMREGIVYELDTRLIPSGRSGAPVVSIESFENHHRQRAHTWEHIALMPSRVVAGNKALIAQIDVIKRQVIKTPRDQDQFMRDALKMWDRVATHRISASSVDVMNSKLSVGGLMQAEYLASCLVIKNRDELNCDDISFANLLQQSALQSVLYSNNQDKVLTNEELKSLPEIIQFWRIQQLWERLLGKTDQRLDSIAPQYLERLLLQSGVDSLDALKNKKSEYARIVEQSMMGFFEPLKMSASEIEEWHEVGVKWLS